MNDLTKAITDQGRKLPLKPCPFCTGVDLTRIKQHRDSYDFENAIKRVLTMTLVHCNQCFSSALEDVWNSRGDPAAMDAVTRVVEKDMTDNAQQHQ
jgi:hypothetical protein